MKSLENLNLTGQLLIAMPSMSDPLFSQAIIFICTHNEDGAMGIVVNRHSGHQVSSLFEQFKIEVNSSPYRSDALYIGGPVQQDRGFILHSPSNIEYDSTITVNDAITLTTSIDILNAAANTTAPDKMLFAIGYAGWAAGQLEEEMGLNSWLNLETKDTQALHEVVFNVPPEERFNLAMGMMGLSLSNLSDVAGHA